MDLDDLLVADTARSERADHREVMERILGRLARAASDARRVAELSAGRADELLDGVLALRGQLEEALRAEGAGLIGVPGEAPDRERHRIVETRDGAAPPEVVAVECEGLIWNGRIIHKADVVVRRPSGTTEK